MAKGGRYTNLFVLCGAFLLNMSACLGMIYGNLATYIYSYHYNQAQQDFHPILSEPWMNGLCETFSAFGVLVMRVTRHTVGLKVTAAFSIVLCVSGMLLSFFTVQKSLWATAITYTVIGGFGNGLLAVVTVLFLDGWFDSSLGTACGLASSSSGIGGFVFNQIITAYINPENLAPDIRKGEISYFSQPQIIERTPMVFVIIGMITAALHVTGFFMLKEAPVSPIHDQTGPESDREKENLNHDLNTAEQTFPPRKKRSENDTDTVKINDEAVLQHADVQSFETSEEKTPNQVLKLEIFYIVWFSLLAQALGLLITSTYFKLFAQLWIADDEFLAMTGALSCLSTAVFRFLCGSLVDRFGLKSTLVFHLASTAICLFLWYVTAIIDRWLYLIWTNILISICGTQFVLYPLVNIKLFGSKSFATNMFLIQTARLIVMIALPPLLTLALEGLGWFRFFSVGALVNFASLLLVVTRMQTTF